MGSHTSGAPAPFHRNVAYRDWGNDACPKGRRSSSTGRCEEGLTGVRWAERDWPKGRSVSTVRCERLELDHRQVGRGDAPPSKNFVLLVFATLTPRNSSSFSCSLRSHSPLSPQRKPSGFSNSCRSGSRSLHGDKRRVPEGQAEFEHRQVRSPHGPLYRTSLVLPLTLAKVVYPAILSDAPCSPHLARSSPVRCAIRNPSGISCSGPAPNGAPAPFLEDLRSSRTPVLRTVVHWNVAPFGPSQLENASRFLKLRTFRP
ncbi:MAG: hypothetical protein PWR16_1636 [Methanoculleus sp.]|nr:hypothetical protein [Methanoculleus sp.]